MELEVFLINYKSKVMDYRDVIINRFNDQMI